MGEKDGWTGQSEWELSRRQFLKASLGAAAGFYTLFEPASPRTAGAAGEWLTMLTWSHFVPESDAELRKQLEHDFAKDVGIKARLDTIAVSQLPAKRAVEAQSRGGHDIVVLDAGDPSLYKDLLVDLSDLKETLGREHGGWFGLGKELGMKDGPWRAIPWYFVSFPLLLRTDLWEEAGEKAPPDTWEDLLRGGEKLKSKGHPGGIPISHCNDSNAILRGIMWGYGASETDEKGQAIAINSPQTAQALEFVNELYQRVLDPEVLSWDDASNNRFIISGKGSFTFNPISAYKTALKHGTKIPGTDRLVHQALNHFIPPRGPGGRHMYAYPVLLGVWNFASNKEPARKFLEYHFSKERFNAYIAASGGYNQPLLKDFTEHPIWSSNPKYAFAPQIGQFSHTQGHPGAPTQYSQLVMDLFIIPDMFANVVTGRMKIKEAMEWAEKEIKQIYGGKKKVRP